MKNLFKIAALTITVALGILAVVVRAQPPIGGSILGPPRAITAGMNGWTNRIAGQTSVTNTTQIDARTFREIAIQFTCASSTADTATKTLWLGRNNDGSLNIETFGTLTLTSAGTAPVTVCTNLAGVSMGGAYAFYYVTIFTNAAATAFATNYYVTWNGK